LHKYNKRFTLQLDYTRRRFS